ncbi:zinc finger protein 846-like [Pieris napi]|uniref:zinc finger protein 846-like n=1 Tax=Pieris napi TaxID=78633 RepID=UPI001FBB8838|nr:zinc finger protein 846-like [Pieris napi]
MPGVVTRRGVRRGFSSAFFSVDNLAQELASISQPANETVYVEAEDGVLRCGSPARTTLQAALAPSPPAAALLLEVCAPPKMDCSSGEATLRLRLAADAPPHADLTMWFDETTLALLDMPFLTLRNITGKRNYKCHECSVEFDNPNPLKIHLFSKCQPFDEIRFWKKCVEILRGNSITAAATLSTAVDRVAFSSPAWEWRGGSEMETLAAAWGRVGRGHVCVYCGKLYSRKYGLKIHIRTHTGYKPLRCRYCARPFGDPSNLNKHLRLHAAADAAPSSPSPHACPLCGKALARRRDLQRHLRTHHATESPELDTSDLSK